jgi:hypothetical protein
MLALLAGCEERLNRQDNASVDSAVGVVIKRFPDDGES